MFDMLKSKLTDVFDGLARRGALSESDVDAALREVRLALLDADVALPAVKAFTAGKATSASSKASRTSRSAASTSDSLSAPRRASPSKTSVNLLFSISNMVLNLLALCCFALPPSSKLQNASLHPCSKTSRTCETR